ncbi:AlpA family phage regulatory protein [Vibrio cholerae]|uniref:helix-turn-helix transcriptional regulator n=1 Tax=Vibrio cholerae TaxID=666 RepID=UPI0004E3C7E5|nr:AlpA family phage regulatory protein [Vibrio cholerae]MDF4534707.1 AlpA family phage regulatory protein [Vibrio parahaemolyticus]EGQ8121607.1 AlpA family phage regulatory protein [Vibrio cholerae]EGQ9108006.1 AlpA family phage regulatory protein [Vibrio cholerae]EGQ9170891.1 AlpA family phage regulatory protein [Vibrio cholerae]EGR0525178.1 AlpA family phage regulatory protein [Vibrio cholerae]
MTAIEKLTQPNQLSCDRFVREAERRRITAISRSQAWKLEKEGRFPPRIKLGSRSVVWRLSDLAQWLDKQAGQYSEEA